jgi:NADH-quinone oxidoreductase subunit H
MAFAMVPITPTWGVADLNDRHSAVHPAMAGLSVYAVMFAGWSSNNKYSLLGGAALLGPDHQLRSVHGAVADGRGGAGRQFNMRDIVEAQEQTLVRDAAVLRLHHLCTAGVPSPTAAPLTSRKPSRSWPTAITLSIRVMKWGMFFVGEYIGVVLVSALIVTLFFGGWHRCHLDCRPSSGLPSRPLFSCHAVHPAARLLATPAL